MTHQNFFHCYRINNFINDEIYDNHSDIDQEYLPLELKGCCLATFNNIIITTNLSRILRPMPISLKKSFNYCSFFFILAFQIDNHTFTLFGVHANNFHLSFSFQLKPPKIFIQLIYSSSHIYFRSSILAFAIDVFQQ